MLDFTRLDKVRRQRPLIHCVSNIVTANDCANLALAVGASPMMAQAPEEMEAISAVSDATVLNTGTPDAEKFRACRICAVSARHPVVLDPVGVGASPWRLGQVRALLDLFTPSILRVNLGEARALLGSDGQEQGVQAVQLLLSDGSRHELGPCRLSGSIPGFRVDTGGVIRQEAVESRTGGDTVRYGEIMVPRGGEYRMVLADGTRVMLNAETRLRFPEAFGDGERRVFLEGEAYFEVAKERERPFWVDFREGTVRVLGTQFNVKAYGGEEAVATLVHGKVEVARGQEAVVLQPGEQCRIAAGEAHALIVGKADLMSTLAWKNGEFVFKDASLEQVIDELARWYNVEMMYDHSLFRESRVHIYMNRSQTLDEALDMLSKAWNIRYERQGTKVWLGERHTGGTDSD